MEKTYLIINIAIFSFMACKCIMLERYTQIDVKNESQFITACYIPLIGMGGAVYPDTTLMISFENIECNIMPREIMHSTISNISFENWVLSFPKDTVSVYFFNQDTLNAYPWEKIKQDYNILQRYDLSIEDIYLLKDKYGTPVIVYPPTIEMKDIKMYPPYQ